MPPSCARGLVTQQTDGRGVVTDQTYDTAGRMLTKTFPAASSENIAYTYDSTTGGNKGVGRVTSITDQSGSTAIVYDARGNMVAETRTVAGQAYATAYAYNAADQVTQITYPSGRIVDYARDAQGKISGVTTRQTVASASVDVATGITYLPMSNLVQSLTSGNGLAEINTYTQDLAINVLQVADGATDVVNRAHARSDNLNLTGITDGVTGANSVTLGYHASNRLQSAGGPWGSKSYVYDGVGNRTQEVTTVGMSTTTDVYSYPGTSNRLSSIVQNGATTTRAFTYDGSGNTLTDNRSGSTTTYTYNKRNRMETATSGALVWGYTYNAREQLVARNLTVGGTNLTHFVHDIFGNVIAETDGTAAGTTREYIWLPEAEIAPTKQSRAAVDRPLAIVDGVGGTPSLWMVHVDHLNRPIKMTDATKASVWDAVWLPWGGSHAITGTATLNARLPGQWFQLEAGLHYNWHRSYDPTIGRYTQPDPLRFVDGPSVYRYAGGSPGQYVDPDGRVVIILPTVIGGATLTISALDVAIGTGLAIVLTLSGDSKSQAKPDRTIDVPDTVRGQWVCNARADCDDRIPGNCPEDPKQKFKFGRGSGSTYMEAVKAAKKSATGHLGCQPKHIDGMCRSPRGDVVPFKH